jgi:hypothetical protein
MAILRLFSALRSQPSRGVGALCFFSLPLGAYAAQELIERLLSAESLPFVAGVEPRFLLGLALQLPFAALAFALGWLALRVPHAFRRLLAGRSHALRRWSGPSLLWTPLLSGPIPRIAALSRGHPRAPPQLV